MNTAAELIAEKDAATLARVSASTLARFAEAGYFQVETSGSDRFYSRRALAAVFGVPMEESQPETAPKNVIQFPQPAPVAPAEQPEVAVAETIPSPEQADPVAAAAIEQPAENIEKAAQPGPKEEPAAQPVSDLTQILQMHSDILSRQEREIEELRSERDWLRRRIEKLEEKAERDQVLLLNEAQTVKQLIQLQSHRKSTIRQALEWFGIVEEQKLPAEQK